MKSLVSMVNESVKDPVTWTLFDKPIKFKIGSFKSSADFQKAIYKYIVEQIVPQKTKEYEDAVNAEREAQYNANKRLKKFIYDYSRDYLRVRIHLLGEDDLCQTVCRLFIDADMGSVISISNDFGLRFGSAKYFDKRESFDIKTPVVATCIIDDNLFLKNVDNRLTRSGYTNPPAELQDEYRNRILDCLTKEVELKQVKGLGYWYDLIITPKINMSKLKDLLNDAANDPRIKRQIELNGSISAGIASYYASKKSGDYTGD